MHKSSCIELTFSTKSSHLILWDLRQFDNLVWVSRQIEELLRGCVGVEDVLDAAVCQGIPVVGVVVAHVVLEVDVLPPATRHARGIAGI